MPEDDVCGICRVQFDGTCPTCKYPGDECTLRKPYTQSISSMFSQLISVYSHRQVWSLVPHGNRPRRRLWRTLTLTIVSTAS